MIYPIVAYGDPVLKSVAQPFQKQDEMNELIENMFETMYNAQGVGLAAPQIGLGKRLFIVDATPFLEEEDDEVFKKVFINPQILEEDGDEWAFEEGCLSIPGIREEVYRKEKIRIKYFDDKWKEHIEEYDGYIARVIQHEYDHLEGILFTDHLSALKRKLLKKKLVNISKGKVNAGYRLKSPLVKR